jgi:hypothetical protein
LPSATSQIDPAFRPHVQALRANGQLHGELNS